MSVCVIKYGSSVLQSAADLVAVAADITQRARDFDNIVAVVSAFEGRTTQLIELARDHAIEIDSPDYAALAGAGELESATALQRVLLKRSIDASAIAAPHIGFIAEGPRDDADPKCLDRNAVTDLLDRNPVLIMPGFSAIDRNEEPILLGRGGSDLTAIHLAAGLGLDRARLVKDVDAVYDCDPNANAGAQRLRCIDYDTALEVAGELIQPKALRYAAERGVIVEIAALGAPPGTIISKI